MVDKFSFTLYNSGIIYGGTRNANIVEAYMGHYDKLYDKISSNVKDVSFSDLHKLLTKVGGFDCRQGIGDHYVFSHPDLTVIVSVDSRNKGKQLKPIYVKKALAAFKEANPQHNREGIEK